MNDEPEYFQRWKALPEEVRTIADRCVYEKGLSLKALAFAEELHKEQMRTDALAKFVSAIASINESEAKTIQDKQFVRYAKPIIDAAKEIVNAAKRSVQNHERT